MKVNKVELAEKINALGGLDNETKSQLLELLHERKRYGLVWENHKEDVEERLRSELPVLREVKDKFIPSDDPDAPNHILIEGDNLEALTALSYTHEGKIDVIYIDPPYNTGNKDFVYNDAFVDSEDEYRHSKWLSFMAKRLKIAKRLLSDKGVIFISIDDNEQAALKLLCDEVFGERNCLANLIWNLGTGTQAGHFTRSHEYILVYAKKKENIPNFSGGEGIIDHSALKKISVKNPPVEFNFKAGTEFDAPDGTELFGNWGGSEKTTLVAGRMVAEDRKLKYDVTLSAGFAMANQMRAWFKGEKTIDSKGQDVIKFYFNASGVLHYQKEKSVINPSTVLTEVANTKQGTNKIKEIFDDNLPFDFAKPIGLLVFLLSLREKDSVILDFFAGSGTTLHATMQLNADGGHRQCILVTNNENNICEEVTYERNKRVINGYTTPKGEKIEGLHNNTLRYYKTDFVGRENTLQNRRKLVYLATDLLCIKENCYNEQPCIDKQARFFTNKDKRLIILYNPDFIPELVEFISCLPQGEKINVYVFADGAYPYTDDFSEVLDKIELCAIPDAILNAMRRVLPKKKVKTLDTINPDKSMQAEIQQALENASVNDYKKTEIW